MYHPLLCLAEASPLGHPFIKSETCAWTISLVSHLVFTKRCMEQGNRERANPCLLNTDAPLPATRQREDAFFSFVERKKGGSFGWFGRGAESAAQALDEVELD